MQIAVIGVGNRARKYLSCLPAGVRVAALVEPEPVRLRQAALLFGVPPESCYGSADEFFASACPGIEAAIVAAPDRLHVPLALACVRKGWHVLLEKPAATGEGEYRELLEASRAAGVHVGVCLEMRFHPYFRRVRELAATLGPVRHISHIEHIGPDRMAHTFVRGLWSQSAVSGPIFLSKCCHDADFLLWLTGAGSVGEVHSSGSISRFRADCAPDGAADRCVRCPLERSCRYLAVDLYRRRKEWISGFDIPEGSTFEEVIGLELNEGRYGRCVYRCDNDVYDTQAVTAILEGGTVLEMGLEGTSLEEGREIVISGRDGVLETKRGVIEVKDADGKLLVREDYSALEGAPLHGGADSELVAAFFGSIASGREPEASLASAFPGHLLCFRAGI